MEQEEIFTSRIDLSGLKSGMDRVRQEIAKILVGQNKAIDLILTAILADGHVLIEGVPGIAKTLTAKLTAKAINLNFSRIQFTPDLMPSDVLGTSVFNVKKSEFEFRAGPIFSNIVLIDEINRAPAKTQSALFEVMEERQATIDGTTYPMKDPYIVLATQNPIEQEGTYRLPEAQIDRFLMKIEMGYPTLEEEISILDGFHNSRSYRRLDEVTTVLQGQEIISFREIIRNVHVEERLMQYIAKIIGQTRNHPDIYLGGSPRASLSILASAKAYAGIMGRDFITPEDVRFVLSPVLKHRLILSPEKEMEGVNPDTVIKQIADSIEVPR